MTDDAAGESFNPEHPLWTDVIYHGTMKHFGESIWNEQSLNSLHCKRMFIHFAITLYPDLDKRMAGIKTRGSATCYLEWDPLILHDAGYMMKYVRERSCLGQANPS